MMEENTNNNSDSVNNELYNTLPEDNKKSTTTCCTNKCDKMFRIMNVLTFTGVIVLFILYFCCKKPSEKATVNNKGTGYSIAYVNSDSLMHEYKLFEVYKTSLEGSKKRMEDDMAVKAKKFEQDVADYQKKVQSYSITSDQAQKVEGELKQRQQQLLDLKDNLSNQLAQMELANQTALFDSIISALKSYNVNQKFDYILGYSKGSGILLANEKYDITPSIVEILNKNYDKKK